MHFSISLCLTWRCLINPVHINKKERGWNVCDPWCRCWLFIRSVLFLWSILILFIDDYQSCSTRRQEKHFCLRLSAHSHCFAEGRQLRRAEGLPQGHRLTAREMKEQKAQDLTPSHLLPCTPYNLMVSTTGLCVWAGILPIHKKRYLFFIGLPKKKV